MKNTEPKSFIQGESLEWQRCFQDYSDYTLTYYFRGAGKGFDAVGVYAEDEFTFTVTSLTTSQMQPGDYAWQLFAVKDDSKILLDSGSVKVKAGLAALGAEATFDGRTENKKILDAIRAMIARKATLDQQDYAIGNRQLKRIPIPELIQLEQRYSQLVSRENQAERLRKGGKFFKQVLIRMK